MRADCTNLSDTFGLSLLRFGNDLFLFRKTIYLTCVDICKEMACRLLDVMKCSEKSLLPSLKQHIDSGTEKIISQTKYKA